MNPSLHHTSSGHIALVNPNVERTPSVTRALACPSMMQRLAQQHRDIIDECLFPLSNRELARLGLTLHAALTPEQIAMEAPTLMFSVQRLCRTRYLKSTSVKFDPPTASHLSFAPLFAEIVPARWPKLLFAQERIRNKVQRDASLHSAGGMLSDTDIYTRGSEAFSLAGTMVSEVYIRWPKDRREVPYGHTTPVTALTLLAQRRHFKEQGRLAVEALRHSGPNFYETYVGKFVAATALAMAENLPVALSVFEAGWQQYTELARHDSQAPLLSLPTVARPYKCFTTCLFLAKNVGLMTGHVSIIEFVARCVATLPQELNAEISAPSPNDIMHLMLSGHVNLLKYYLSQPHINNFDLTTAIHTSMLGVNQMYFTQATRRDNEVSALSQRVSANIDLAYQHTKKHSNPVENASHSPYYPM